MLFTADSVAYKRIAEIANLKKVDLARIAEVPNSAVRFDNKINNAVAAHLREIGLTANLVASYFKGDENKVRLWFRMANPMLGNISPSDTIRIGRHQRLLAFVQDACEAEASSAATS